MPALESPQEAALEAARLARHELLEHFRVPSLMSRHPGTGGFGLLHVGVLVHFLLRGNGGENELRPESPRGPPEHSASPGRPTARDRRTGLAQSIPPEP